MLLMTRRPSATTDGIAEKFESINTSWATPRVASLPRRHRHAAVGVLQREHVVDAVAGHRHGVTA